MGLHAGRTSLVINQYSRVTHPGDEARGIRKESADVFLSVIIHRDRHVAKVGAMEAWHYWGGIQHVGNTTLAQTFQIPSSSNRACQFTGASVNLLFQLLFPCP
jgi:hypothetical protein